MRNLVCVALFAARALLDAGLYRLPGANVTTCSEAYDRELTSIHEDPFSKPSKGFTPLSSTAPTCEDLPLLRGHPAALAQFNG